MAKIDTTSIQGYSEMTPDEKVAALEGYDYPDSTGSTDEVNRLKSLLAKANSEAAQLKRERNARLTDEERAKQENDQRMQAMEEELQALREEKAIAGYKAKYLVQGYDEALASDSAEALARGDMTKVFDNQAKFMKSFAKNLQADALRGTPRPPAGSGTSTMTKDEIMGIRDAGERQAAIMANMELFRKD